MQEPSLPMQIPAFRQVHSGHGVEWWSSAWQLLFQRGAAVTWIAMCFIAMAIYGLLHLFSLLGLIAARGRAGNSSRHVLPFLKAKA